MNTAILQLYNKPSLSLLSSNQLIFSETLTYDSEIADKIYAMLQPHEIIKFNVVIKTTLFDANLLGNKEIHRYELDDKVLSFGCADVDLQILQTLTKALRVGKLSLFTNVDYYKYLASGKTLILDDYVNDMASLCVIDGNKVIDFSIARPTSVEGLARELHRIHKVDTIINATNIRPDLSGIQRFASNLDNMSDEYKYVLLPTLFTVEYEPTLTIDVATNSTFLRVEEEEDIVLLGEYEEKQQVNSTKEEISKQIFEVPFDKNEKQHGFMSSLLHSNLVEKAKDVISNIDLSSIIHGDEEDDAVIKTNKIMNVVIGTLSVFMVIAILISMFVETSVGPMENKASAYDVKTKLLMNYKNYLMSAVKIATSKSNYYADLNSALKAVKFSGVIGEVTFLHDKVSMIIYASNEREAQRFASGLPPYLKVEGVSDDGKFNMGSETFTKYTLSLKQAQN
jgi:hypothetical protein